MQQSEHDNISFVHRILGPRRRMSAPLVIIKDYRILLSLSLLFSSKLFRSPLHGDFLLLYSLLQLIKALHLLTIWTFTWVPVPSDIHLIFLWVALANVTLFACLLHINAAGKVASLHLMRQLWFLPRRLTFSSFFLLCEAHPTTHVCLEWFFTVKGVHIGLIFVCPRRHSSADDSFK